MKINLNLILLKISADSRIYNSHSVLIIALLSVYQQENYKMPFQISRKKLMKVTKLSSVATYHKCIRELVNLGYILYEPSYHPLKGSEVYLTAQLMES
jgi:hypothetical protein